MHNDRQPLYIQIQRYFKELISSGKLSAEDKIPSEKELMEQFNVSRITVANALAQLAKEGWIYRIPGRGSFVNKDAQQLSKDLPRVEPRNDDRGAAVKSAPLPSRKMIGFLIPSIFDFFAIRLIKGLNQVLEDTEYYLVIQFTNNSKEREEQAILELIRNGAVGLIVFPSDAENYNEEILALKLRQFPFVLIDRYFPGVETNFVCSDGSLGAQLAVNHLWDLGHRKIAICSDSPLPTLSVEHRISGYMEALKQKGVLIDPSLILTEFHVDYNKINEEHALYRYIKNSMATAIITLNARLGLHIASIAKRLKIHVPEDLSIVTFDDPSPGLDESGSFTYISQAEEEMGRKAMQILLDLLSKPSDQSTGYNKIIMKPELVVRTSTSPVKTEAKTPI
ncbi:substrate-binding domain-containing protein [Paenibacillus sp. sptzw28]|uniref:GntR family transcriptional regulator n=1 Tax=Paenibacillus sp. sptzw28 TaxID=715179 RepID=UPI001C6E680E|nr:substrate-binding domain-containing protein [Paenibacillus sp. sptzw28]QYR22348.1 substrate-binding domain-containing protein [Paenibacillus sp. sptzw28]